MKINNINKLLDRREVRDKFFRELDYKVLRFFNNEVENDIKGVLEKIQSYL